MIGLYLWADTILISQGGLRWVFMILSVGVLVLLTIGPAFYRKYRTNLSAVDTIPLDSVIGVVSREQVTLIGYRPVITIFFGYDEETESWERRVLQMSLLGIDGSAEVNQMRNMFGTKEIPVLSESEFENRKTALQEQNDKITPRSIFHVID